MIYYPQARATLQVMFDGFGAGPDSKTLVVQTPVKRCAVHYNGYKLADSFSLEIDRKVLPFHPDVIRLCAVELYLFTTDGYTTDVADYATDANLKIAGLVERPSMRMGSDGKTVTLEGQDYTSLLIARPWRPGRRIPTGLGLDEVVQQLADEATRGPTGEGVSLKVRFVGDRPGADAPTVGAQPLDVTRRVVKAPPKVSTRHRAHKRGVPVKADENTWDVIYKLCLRHGFICFVELDRIVISTPHALADEGSRAGVYRVAYGRDLDTLEVERHIGRVATPQIVATSYDPATRQALEARWPPPGAKNDARTTVARTKGGQVAARGTFTSVREGEVRRVDAPPGIVDPDQLHDFARCYYHQISRGESTTRFSTRFLTDLEGRDLLQVRAGTGVVVGWDGFNAEELEQLSVAQREDRLVVLGYTDEVAHVIATELDKLDQFARPLYVREASMEFDVSSGISLSAEAINFVAVERDDVR